MSNVRNARVLQYALHAEVDKIVKNQYGNNYIATVRGLIRCKDDQQPFERTVGNWHIKDNVLYVEVTT